MGSPEFFKTEQGEDRAGDRYPLECLKALFSIQSSLSLIYLKEGLIDLH